MPEINEAVFHAEKTWVIKGYDGRYWMLPHSIQGDHLDFPGDIVFRMEPNEGESADDFKRRFLKKCDEVGLVLTNMSP